MDSHIFSPGQPRIQLLFEAVCDIHELSKLCCRRRFFPFLTTDRYPFHFLPHKFTQLDKSSLEATTMSSSLTKPLIAAESEGLSILETPAYASKLRNPKTGLVNGMVLRATTNEKDRFVFCLQTGNVDGSNRTMRKPMLLAQRQICSKYYIFDISKEISDDDELFSTESFKSKDDHRFVGKLQRSSRYNSNYVCYSLSQGRHEDEVHVATVMYEIPSIKAHFMKKTFCVAHVAIFSQMPAGDDSQGIEFVLDKTVFADAVDSHLSNKKTLGQIIAPTQGIYVSSTKVPVKDKEGVFRVNFGNRGKITSKENMKLTDYLHKDESNLQMVASNAEKNDYSVDFAAPFNAFQPSALLFVSSISSRGVLSNRSTRTEPQLLPSLHERQIVDSAPMLLQKNNCEDSCTGKSKALVLKKNSNYFKYYFSQKHRFWPSEHGRLERETVMLWDARGKAIVAKRKLDSFLYLSKQV